MKKLKKLLLFLIVIFIITCGYLYYDARYKACDRLKIRYELITDERIPESFDHTQILFFSDIYYNSFMDKARLTKIMDTIEQIQPDIIVFLGDLFNNPTLNPPTTAVQAELQEMLTKLDAPLGKFAIYGDQDRQSQTTKQLFDSIMAQANFEILSDTSITLTDHDSSGINLVALNNVVNGEANIAQAYQLIDKSAYTLAICHTPDMIDNIDGQMTDLFISGHSLGGQIYLPFYGAVFKFDGAVAYNKGKQKVANTLLDITNGLGTTKYDMRLFSDPEILVYEFTAQ